MIVRLKFRVQGLGRLVSGFGAVSQKLPGFVGTCHPRLGLGFRVEGLGLGLTLENI